MNYINEIAEVLSNKEIAKNIYSAILKSPKIAKTSKPGQFINILPNKNWEKAMRRPMSLAGTDGNNIEIIYKVFGEGTRLISNWKNKDRIDNIGPLGNCWKVSKKKPVLIGGGVGIAPIMYLSNYLNKIKQNHICIMGARDSSEHFLEHNPDKNIILSTDDGSLGIKGNVVDALRNIPLDNQEIHIYSCGPPVMMENIKKYAELNKIDCQVALETIMACGFGICQGCTVEYNEDSKQEHSYRNKFGLACLDGPVFDAKEVKTCKL